MASFPQLPSGNNSAISAAAEAAHAAGALYNVGENRKLRKQMASDRQKDRDAAFAEKQREYNEKHAKEDTEEERGLIDKGWVEEKPPQLATNDSGRPTLKQAAPDAPIQPGGLSDALGAAAPTAKSTAPAVGLGELNGALADTAPRGFQMGSFSTTGPQSGPFVAEPSATTQGYSRFFNYPLAPSFQGANAPADAATPQAPQAAATQPAQPVAARPTAPTTLYDPPPYTYDPQRMAGMFGAPQAPMTRAGHAGGPFAAQLPASIPGATPAQPVAATPAQAPAALTPTQAPGTPGGPFAPQETPREPIRVTTRSGKIFRKLTPEELLNDTNSIVPEPGSEQEALLKSVGMHGRVPLAHLTALTGLAKQLQAAHDAADKKKESVTVDQAASDKARAVGFTLPVGSRVPYNVWKNVMDAITPKDKTDAQQRIEGKAGPGGEAIVWDKTAGKMVKVPYPAGTKDELTPGQKLQREEFGIRRDDTAGRAADAAEARANRRADLQQKVEEKAAQDHEKAGLKKDAMQAMAQGYWDASNLGPGATYFPPRLVNGNVIQGSETRMPDDQAALEARRAELKKLAAGFDRTAKNHQNEQERIEKQHGWGKFAPSQAPAQTPTQPTAAKPAAAQTPPAKRKSLNEIFGQ